MCDIGSAVGLDAAKSWLTAAFSETEAPTFTR
jgi:hypothetical protein